MVVHGSIMAQLDSLYVAGTMHWANLSEGERRDRNETAHGPAAKTSCHTTAPPPATLSRTRWARAILHRKYKIHLHVEN